MNALEETDRIFFGDTGLDRDDAEKLVTRALKGYDGGELFLEFGSGESINWQDQGRGTQINPVVYEGFGLRRFRGTDTDFSTSNEITGAALGEAAKKLGRNSRRKEVEATRIVPAAHSLYQTIDPSAAWTTKQKLDFVQEVDQYVRASNPAIKQVTVNLANSFKAVQIILPNGDRCADLRPLAQCSIAVVAERNGRKEQGSSGFGGRYGLSEIFNPTVWQMHAKIAADRALTNLDSVPAPSGQMIVVCGPGWPGVLLHEAVGHGLEGDFNRMKTSCFTGLIGQKVAADGVSVIDQGNIAGRRGSLNFDDEGTPTQENILIEDGILVGYMQDRLNARLMGMKLTGNGRRESYAHMPMPRMTNTFMLAGKHDPQEIIESVPYGIYAPYFGGGRVDITSGRFNFSMAEAYLIENGKITSPVKGATLVGTGSEVMQKITMLGKNTELDQGVGRCGKEGQWVPVGLGQPTLRIDGITVGGTAPG